MEYFTIGFVFYVIQALFWTFITFLGCLPCSTVSLFCPNDQCERAVALQLGETLYGQVDPRHKEAWYSISGTGGYFKVSKSSADYNEDLKLHPVRFGACDSFRVAMDAPWYVEPFDWERPCVLGRDILVFQSMANETYYFTVSAYFSAWDFPEFPRRFGLTVIEIPIPKEPCEVTILELYWQGLYP